nr:hypothetical protein B296_00023528 [Ipomoea batatas]
MSQIKIVLSDRGELVMVASVAQTIAKFENFWPRIESISAPGISCGIVGPHSHICHWDFDEILGIPCGWFPNLGNSIPEAFVEGGGGEDGLGEHGGGMDGAIESNSPSVAGNAVQRLGPPLVSGDVEAGDCSCGVNKLRDFLFQRETSHRCRNSIAKTPLPSSTSKASTATTKTPEKESLLTSLLITAAIAHAWTKKGGSYVAAAAGRIEVARGRFTGRPVPPRLPAAAESRCYRLC